MMPGPPDGTRPIGRRSRRLRFTHEVQILLPASLVLLLVLSTFTLFSYRDAIESLTDEHRTRALRTARRVAEEVAAAGLPTASALGRSAPGAAAVVVTNAEGSALVSTGLELPSPLSPLQGRLPDQPLALGPGSGLPDTVAAFAPLRMRGERLYVRVDLPASILAAKHRSLAPLTAVVLGVDLALTFLLLGFLRRLLAPYRTLLERARELGVPADEGGDETAFLLSTFERAVAALEQGAARGSPSADEDIAALARTLSASLDNGLLLLDRQGGLLAVNPPGAACLSISPPAPGTPIEKALGDRPELLAVLRQSVDSRRGVQRREIVLDRSGHRVTLGLSVHPLRRDDGMVRGFLVLFTDLTDAHREAEESRLAEGLAKLGEMAAGVAHELRNSLATLRGYLGLFERRAANPGDWKDAGADLAEMRRETDHLQRVVDDFLAFARPETARVEKLRLATVVEQAAADPVLQEISIEIDPGDAGDTRIQGDGQLLERAVRNLLRNAMEATPERSAGPPGGERPVVRVALARRDGEVEVAIEDRGPGLSASVRRRLFQPFVTGRPGGVGLGLALSQRIASLHGGRIRIEDRQGGGTRVRLQLPAVDSES